jgi:hypothetical protein
MSLPMSTFHTLFSHRRRFAAFTAPRRPRHPLLRVALGALGVAVLLGLLFVSVFVGVAMLAVGVLLRLAKRRGRPAAAHARNLEGDYRVVGKAQLPLAR